MKKDKEVYIQEDVKRVITAEGIKVNLRPFNVETDLEYIYKWINDPKVNRNLLANGPMTLAQEKNWAEKIGKDSTEVLFAIETRDENRFIGIMGIHRINWMSGFATTGALIGEKDCWGKGYGSDAKMLVLHHAFYTLGLRRINSSVVAFNKRSAGSLKHCGYKKEATLKSYHYINGKYWDSLLFRIFREEFDPIWKVYEKKLKQFNKQLKKVAE